MKRILRNTIWGKHYTCDQCRSSYTSDEDWHHTGWLSGYIICSNCYHRNQERERGREMNAPFPGASVPFVAVPSSRFPSPYPVPSSSLQHSAISVPRSLPGGFMRVYLPGNDCPICAKPLSSEPLSAPPCGHVLHESCLRQYIASNAQCPICRAVITI